METHQNSRRPTAYPHSREGCATTSILLMGCQRYSHSMMSRKAMVSSMWSSICGKEGANMVRVISTRKHTAPPATPNKPNSTKTSRKTWRKRGGNFEDKVLKVGESCNDFELQFVSFSHL